MQKAINLFFITTVFFLTACSSLFKEAKNLPAPLPEVKSSFLVKTVWSVDVGTSDDYVFTPVNVENSIFAANALGDIVRLDNQNGHVIWKVKAELPLTAGVGADSTTLAVVGDK